MPKRRVNGYAALLCYLALVLVGCWCGTWLARVVLGRAGGSRLGRVGASPALYKDWLVVDGSDERAVVLVTLYDGSERLRDVSRASRRDKIAYARRHGYALMIVPGTLDSARHIVWSKIKIMHLLASEEVYRYIVWLDFDTLIQRPERPMVGAVFPPDDQHSLWLVGDVQGGRSINAGFMMVRSGYWAARLFERVYEHWEREVFWFMFPGMNREQDALMAVVHESPPYFSFFTRIMPYAGGQGVWTLPSSGNPGAFLVHFCNCVNGRCADAYNDEADLLYVQGYNSSPAR